MHFNFVMHVFVFIAPTCILITKIFLQRTRYYLCCSTLQSLYKDTLAQRDSLSNELITVKRSATPRPDWDRCASYLEGGSERWAALSQGRSSDRKVDILLAQIAGVDVSEIIRDDVFQGEEISGTCYSSLRIL